ncbi:MAG: hypothetical protein K2H37_03650 [Lachnospiraceae bacterium]|nr:hypothetical protein [Lachnospiraceae bacterium]
MKYLDRSIRFYYNLCKGGQSEGRNHYTTDEIVELLDKIVVAKDQK